MICLIKESSLFPKGLHQGTTTHPTQCLAGMIAQLAERFGTEVGQFMVLPVTPQILHRIKLWGISRQKLQDQPTLLLIDHRSDHPAVMSPKPIPDHQHLSGQMAQQVTEEIDYLRASDRTRIKPEVKLIPSYSSDRREYFPVEMILQHRRLPLRSPGTNSMGSLAQSGFIDEDDRPVLDPGFFLSWGHRTRFHRRIFSSSRSRALPTGRWQLQPNFPKSRHTWPGWYFTPKRSWINSATRSTVQSPEPYPNDSGPFLRSVWSCFSFSSTNLGFRPARPAAFSPLRPQSFSCLAHRLIDWRCTPTRRAAPASGTPCSKSRAACRRLRSNILKSRRTPAGFPIIDLLSTRRIPQ